MLKNLYKKMFGDRLFGTSGVLNFGSPIRLANLPVAPTSTADGILFYNTVDKRVQHYQDGEWHKAATESYVSSAVSGVQGTPGALMLTQLRFSARSPWGIGLG